MAGWFVKVSWICWKLVDNELVFFLAESTLLLVACWVAESVSMITWIQSSSLAGKNSIFNGFSDSAFGLSVSISKRTKSNWDCEVFLNCCLKALIFFGCKISRSGKPIMSLTSFKPNNFKYSALASVWIPSWMIATALFCSTTSAWAWFLAFSKSLSRFCLVCRLRL